MHRFALILAAATLAWSQSENPFHRPPPEVDEALRARVKEFFGYHVTGEFRKAEQMVAEDTKDYFYTHNKPRYLGIEIRRIDYSDDFSRATVLVMCEQYIKMPGFLDKPMKVPTPSAWKLENGKWVWWVDPANAGRSPFGPMKEGPKAAPSPGAAPITQETAPTSVDFLFKQVKLDRNRVTLKPGESATIDITNGAPGAMSVVSRSKLPGIQTSFDKPTLQQGEKATLTIKATASAKSASLNLEVNPIGQILPVQIIIQPPAVPLPPVALDKNQVSLKPGDSATININNNGPGAMTLASHSKLTGIEFSFDKETVQEGETAALTVKAAAKAKSGTLTLDVSPIDQALPIQITVQGPPPQKGSKGRGSR